MCGIKLRLGLFLFLVVSVQLSYSLSPEEEAELPNLTKSELINIIMIYDKTLNQIEIENDKREQTLTLKEQSLNRREISLDQRENRQNEREASLTTRETLLVSLSESHETDRKDSFWHGFALGNLTGATVGGLSGYGLNELIP